MFMSVVNHKEIAIFYIYSSFCFAIIGLSFRIIIRTELSSKTTLLCNNQIYNCILTSHGLIMVFLLVIPYFMATLSNLFVPIFTGVIDITFPRLNILSL